MIRRPFGLKPLILLSLLLLTACQGRQPELVLLPSSSPSGELTLTEVRLETLPHPQKVSGPVAIVYENPLMTTHGFEGEAAEPRLTQTDNVWIPLDVKSSSALSVYHAFELIKKFEDKVIPEFSQKLSWPRRIAFDLQIVGGHLLSNAFYSGSSDLTAITSYREPGLPIAFNSGILAHEHFHAHFHRFVAEEISKDLGPLFDKEEIHLHQASAQSNVQSSCGLDYFAGLKIQRESEDFTRLVNFFMIRGWNEGLADLYATLVTGQTNFFDQSVDLKGVRKVDSMPLFLIPRSSFEEALVRDISGSQPEGRCESLQLAYGMGTEIAKLLYHHLVSDQKDLSLELRENGVRKLFEGLSGLQKEIVGQSNAKSLTPSWMIEKLAPYLNPPKIENP